MLPHQLPKYLHSFTTVHKTFPKHAFAFITSNLLSRVCEYVFVGHCFFSCSVSLPHLSDITTTILLSTIYTYISYNILYIIYNYIYYLLWLTSLNLTPFFVPPMSLKTTKLWFFLYLSSMPKHQCGTITFFTHLLLGTRLVSHLNYEK